MGKGEDTINASVITGGNVYIPTMPEPYPTGGHPDEIDLKEAEQFGKEMVERSRRISAGEIGLIPLVPQVPPLQPEDLGIEEILKEIPNSFKTMLQFHKEKCKYPRCRLCMDNCPMGGIDLSFDPPVIAKPCMSCTFCARICPTGALDDDTYNERFAPQLIKLMPVFILPPLEKAEAEGRFRRLVPIGNIGYDTPLYKVHNKHPQWVIGKGLQ
jgi:ferredoxin